jgi:hypothetical protein
MNTEVAYSAPRLPANIQATRFLFARDGLIRGNWNHYWKFFRKDFHPNDIDDTVILDRAIDLYGLAH